MVTATRRSETEAVPLWLFDIKSDVPAKTETVPLQKRWREPKRRLADQGVASYIPNAEDLRGLGRAPDHDAGTEVQEDVRDPAGLDHDLGLVGDGIEAAGIIE